MEKYSNEMGSTTVEAMIVIPVVMIFIMMFIFIMLISYEKSMQIISVHQKSMSDSTENLFLYSGEIFEEKNNKYYSKKIIKLNGNEYNLNYEYKKNIFTVKGIQNKIELLFYLLSEYGDCLRGFGNEN